MKTRSPSELLLIGLPGILVIPIKTTRKAKGKSKRGVFLLVFSSSRNALTHNLVVIWNEDAGYDYYRLRSNAKHPLVVFDGVPIIEPAKAAPIDLNNYLGMNTDLANGLRAASPRKRRARIFLDDAIESALMTGKGFWGNVKTRHDQSLRRKYARFLHSLELEADQNPTTIEYFLNKRSDAHYVLMRNVYSDTFDFKPRLKGGCDPYSIVRRFLKAIDLFPTRQIGNRNRTRLTIEDEREIKNILKKRNPALPVKEAVRAAFEEQHCGEPSNHQLKKYARYCS